MQNDPRPPYVQVADDLRTAIATGRYSPGDRLPSGRDLAKEYGVAPMTMQRALSTLAAEHLVATYGTRGTFVRSPDDASDPDETVTALTGLVGEVRDLRETVTALEARLAHLEGQEHERPGV